MTKKLGLIVVLVVFITTTVSCISINTQPKATPEIKSAPLLNTKPFDSPITVDRAVLALKILGLEEYNEDICLRGSCAMMAYPSLGIGCSLYYTDLTGEVPDIRVGMLLDDIYDLREQVVLLFDIVEQLFPRNNLSMSVALYKVTSSLDKKEEIAIEGNWLIKRVLEGNEMAIYQFLYIPSAGMETGTDVDG